VAILSNSKEVASFGGFRLDLRSGELRRDGVLVKLQPQPAKVLVLLVSRAGEIVARTEVAEQVWGSETFVDFEHGLNFAIRQIRSALGDDAEQPRFLETLPKRGYRFIAPIDEPINKASPEVAEAPSLRDINPSEDRSRSNPRRWLPIAVAGVLVAVLLGVIFLGWRKLQLRASSPVMVLAVLPFDDLSPKPEPYLVEGLTEEMIAQLTRINPQRLKVIARTSAMQYAQTKKSAREIGRELGADYILENSIRHEGGRVRITAQLVRTADQTHLWAETYEREMVQLLPLENEVAGNIAEQIHVRLLPAAAGPGNAHPVDPNAHEIYLQARHYFNLRSRDGLDNSIDLYKQALAKDPSYAAAYAGLADAYNLKAFYGFDPTMDAVTQAKIAANKALQIDDSIAAAHAALGYTEFMWREDWAAAEKEFDRARELDDNYVPAHQWFALYLAAQGRTDEALNQMQFAQKIDPLSPSVRAGLGYIYYFARNYDEAERQARVALQLNPNLMAAHAVLGWSFTEQKRFPEAISELQTASDLSNGALVYRSTLGRAYALSGDAASAKKILAEVEAVQSEPRGVGTSLAALCFATGDSDRAFYWLGQTAPGDIQANWLRVDPAFDSIRGDPRFAAIVSRLGVKKD
jgi:TolB-like protein/DNA-binding winged helix-turn-helix (wHTH) protein/Flp pilus assembly protein TadD